MNSPTLKRDWKAYYDIVADRPPRKTILTALAAFEQPGIAVDLGCGAGRDTVEILRQNWAVLAIDREPDAIHRLLARPNLNTLQLTTQIVGFEEVQLPKSVDLINASFSIPFCSPEVFPTLWNQIFNSLVTGGRFCGHLFGDRDSWGNSELINCFTRSQVETLLKPYEIELLEEEEHPGKTPLGEDRDWHIFHIVARKK
ncbi:class I SAM-dependent methyltransferase [Pleurocapsa sp. PCC 7319]|uniref:class I SAM-dependent methyltransferase n=1 Tax=Pleurocapsa sp. PCC 7319 TaxID=118161 RepID=UPI00034BAF52|nr:class I SAM-dependent methyltransferase [Pleurocapsa sp. PCC 7319]